MGLAYWSKSNEMEEESVCARVRAPGCTPEVGAVWGGDCPGMQSSDPHVLIPLQ